MEVNERLALTMLVSELLGKAMEHDTRYDWRSAEGDTVAAAIEREAAIAYKDAAQRLREVLEKL